MEKFKNFPDAILSLFGIDLKIEHEELLFEKANNFLKKDYIFEAFLMACIGFRVNRDPKFMPILEKASHCRIQTDNFSDQEIEAFKSWASTHAKFISAPILPSPNKASLNAFFLAYTSSSFFF